MATRNELFLGAVDVLQSGRSVDVLGEHGCGRTHFLARVRDYFVALGWRTFPVTGLPAFQKSPLVALGIAGIDEAQQMRPGGIASSVAALEALVQPGRTLFVVDDWDAFYDFSGGVIRTVQARLKVPVISTRLIHTAHHEAVLPMGGFTTTYRMTLPGMGYAELEAALEGLLGLRFDPGTLSRIFAKSGGNIGLATAVVDAAQRAGTLVVEDGIGRATGSLWSPALRSITDVVLAPLEREAVEALETLALLGPVDIETAAKAVSLDLIGHLEERSFLSVIDIGGGKIVSIRPPLLVEHFRHDGLPGRHSRLLAQIDDLLSAGAALTAEDTGAPRDAATFVRLVHEQTRRRTLQAREGWESAPSLRTAATLLTALEVDGAHDDEEIRALVSRARGLEGSERDRVDWEAVRLDLRAVRDGEPGESVAEMRALAATAPREGGILLGRAVEVEALFGAVPAEDPVGDVVIAGFAPDAQTAVLRARAFWLIVRGRTDEADAVVAELQRIDAGTDPLVDAVIAFSHIAAERFPVATTMADAGLAAAQKAFDAPLIRIYAYLSVLIATADRRMDDAERVMNESTFLGLSAPVPPMSFVGLKTMAAELAARRGQRPLMEELLAEIDAAGLPDGPLLGQSRALVYARLAAVEEGAEAAATACFDGGDALWERGALLSAAHLYVEGLQYSPTPAHWHRLRDRLRSVPAAGIIRQTVFLEALVEGDVRAVARQVLDLETAGRVREALAASVLALRVFEHQPASPELARATSRLTQLRARLHSATEGSAAPSIVTLTPREREVAELIASGLSNAVIAEALVLSVRTVESHVNRLLRKTGLTRRQDIKEFLLAQTPA